MTSWRRSQAQTTWVLFAPDRPITRMVQLAVNMRQTIFLETALRHFVSSAQELQRSYLVT